MALAVGAIVLIPRVIIRLRLSAAKHPSVRGHARMSRRIARLVPDFRYSSDAFFQTDDAPEEIAQQRRIHRCFGHHAALRGIEALLGVELRNLAATARNRHPSAVGLEIGPFQMFDALEQKFVAADLRRLPRTAGLGTRVAASVPVASAAPVSRRVRPSRTISPMSGRASWRPPRAWRPSRRSR